MTVPQSADDPYNIFSLRAQTDHAMLARMRREDPVYATTARNWGARHWFLSRYEDCNDFLRDSRFGFDLHHKLPAPLLTPWLKSPRIEPTKVRHLLSVDPPEHTRMRALVHKAFTPRVMKQLVKRVQEVADQLLDEVRDAGQMDLVEAFALPIPVTMMCEMLGVAAADRARFHDWVGVLFFGPADETAQVAAGMEFFHYMGQRIEESRDELGQNVLSGMVQASEEGDMLDAQELMSMIFLLMTSGFDTTVHMLGTGIYMLLTHPEQLAHFRSEMDTNEALVQSTMEEIVRYAGLAAAAFMRWAWEDVEIRSKTIRQGDSVHALLHSANRDPDTFDDPERFDITRSPNPHIGYGAGVHYCLGAPLARMEAAVAIPMILGRLPNLRLAVDPAEVAWNTAGLYGLSSLPVRF